MQDTHGSFQWQQRLVTATATDTKIYLQHIRQEMRTCRPRFRSQNWQSAAPPAIVPSRKGLISITFFTVCDAAGQDNLCFVRTQA